MRIHIQLTFLTFSNNTTDYNPGKEVQIEKGASSFFKIKMGDHIVGCKYSSIDNSRCNLPYNSVLTYSLDCPNHNSLNRSTNEHSLLNNWFELHRHLGNFVQTILTYNTFL